MKETTQQKGLAAAIFAFVFWGLAPIYFKMLNHVDAFNIIAHRVVWGVLFLAVFLLVRERQSFFSTLKIPLKTFFGLLISGLLIVCNWLIFVWAVTHDQILATSLGYFINPLVNILLGTLFLKERLTKAQMIALTLAAAGTLYLGIYIGQPPWIALALAMSFGFYGLARKLLQVRPLVGLFWETMWLVPAALWYFSATMNTQLQTTTSTMILLFFSGLVTVLPLIGFNYAAKRLSLTYIGFLQYMAPSISFIIAVMFYGEAFTHGHQVAFAGIWTALFIISYHSFKERKRKKLTMV
ncbi:EamA family transporter RarD [Marinicella rhabdoformis]|uniref:EamA family transporter RarD n=1 Tax=Marinicella rhabdoformis TaxID=2580566 RepID=UPI0015CFD5F9|nr:EamA family transporter RarD [Marinicella rhabdoformis]